MKNPSVQGNPISDSRWDYAWDAENRLVQMRARETAVTVGAPNLRLRFAYDYLSRRIQKTVEKEVGSYGSGTWELQSDTRFIYDGWNLVSEVEMKGDAADAPNAGIVQGGNTVFRPYLRRSYVWGPDVSGTEAGAGGVGGLLAVTRHERQGKAAESYWACWDLNGNVIGLASTTVSGRAAVYDYDAFGKTVRENEPEAGLNPIRFSSKYTDEETGLVYYGYRYYSPEMGRWPSRDPIEEDGGINLYGFCRNDAINLVDYLGNKFLWFNGSEIVEYSGKGYVGVGKIDWGTAGQKWSAVSGGTAGKPGLPDGWYKATGLKALAGKADSLEIGNRSEASFTEKGVYFQGTMAAWDKKGYNKHPVEGYGAPQYGYDPKDAHDVAIGKPKNVEFKVGLTGAHGSKVTYAQGYRIHPKDLTTTSGCIGIQGYDLSVSFLTFIKANSRIELYVGNLCGATP